MSFKKRFSTAERSEIVDKSQRCLWTDEGKPGLDYLREVRKLGDETIKRFSLGYIPAHVKHQLAGRIVMPLYDPSGNLVTVTTRAVVPTEDMPVYWHEQYEKSFYLYGLNLAKDTIRLWNFAVIVEGQFDVLQMHNHKLTNVVGACSVNLGDIQFASLRRYTDLFITIFDNDENLSGQKGTEKVMGLAKREIALGRVLAPMVSVDEKRISAKDRADRVGFKIDFVPLQGAKDPDELLRKFGIKDLLPKIKQKVQFLRQEHDN